MSVLKLSGKQIFLHMFFFKFQMLSDYKRISIIKNIKGTLKLFFFYVFCYLTTIHIRLLVKETVTNIKKSCTVALRL